MSHVKSIFGKDIYELTLNDITEFFLSPKEESSILEFKSGDTQLDKIHREVSAFLNTDGGVLIWGSPIETYPENDKTKPKVCQGALTPASISSQDKIMHSIASNIVPAPTRVKAHTIPIENGNIFIIEVPKSTTPPHQVPTEGKYYIRLEREAKAAPHGIVEALFLRRQKPDLDCVIGLGRDTQASKIVVEFKFRNNSIVAADAYGYMINILGVQQVLGGKNLVNSRIEYEKETEMLSYNYCNDNSYLIKGIATTIEFEIIPKYNILAVECGFYCKDAPLECIMSIIDTAAEEPFVKYLHTLEQNNVETTDSIIEYYNANKQAINYSDLPDDDDFVVPPL